MASLSINLSRSQKALQNFAILFGFGLVPSILFMTSVHPVGAMPLLQASGSPVQDFLSLSIFLELCDVLSPISLKVAYFVDNFGFFAYPLLSLPISKTDGSISRSLNRNHLQDALIKYFILC